MMASVSRLSPSLRLLSKQRSHVRMMASAAQAAQLVDFGEHHVTHGLSRMTKGLMSKGEGSYLHFADGRKMLDFTTGIGVTVLGS
jgi:4-aminobutyrate aminotransferase